MAKRKESKHLDYFARVLYALAVGTGAISLWRGAWGLMDLYLFPGDPLLSFIASLVIGILILLFSRRLVEEFVY